MDCPVIKGNHDEDASGNHSLDSMNPVAAAALMWTREQLNEEQRTWLRRLRMVRQVEDFTVVHSTLDQPPTGTTSPTSSTPCRTSPTSSPRSASTATPTSARLRQDPARPGGTRRVDRHRGRHEVLHQRRLGRPTPRRRLARLLRDLRPADHTVVFRRVEYDLATTQRKILEADLPPMLAERLADGQVVADASRASCSACRPRSPPWPTLCHVGFIPPAPAYPTHSSTTGTSAAAHSNSPASSGPTQRIASCSCGCGSPQTIRQRNGISRIAKSP